jgi:hypothetical protein
LTIGAKMLVVVSKKREKGRIIFEGAMAKQSTIEK